MKEQSLAFSCCITKLTTVGSIFHTEVICTFSLAHQFVFQWIQS